MKKLFFSALFAAVALSAAVPPWEAPASANAEKTRFDESRGARHKWKRGQPLPASLADAGVQPDAALVWTGLYLDGGTKGYLLKDSKGNYLAVCTGPGFQSKDHPKRIEGEVGSRVFVGALHYTREEAQVVPVGSKTETWLKQLLAEKAR